MEFVDGAVGVGAKKDEEYWRRKVRFQKCRFRASASELLFWSLVFELAFHIFCFNILELCFP